MNYRHRRKLWYTAAEIYTLSHHATQSGVSRKLSDLADHIDHGGKLQDGVLFVQAARSGNSSWLEWAISFFGCVQPGDAKLLHDLYGEDAISDNRQREAEGAAKRFWRRVKASGLDKQGMWIAEKMAA